MIASVGILVGSILLALYQVPILLRKNMQKESTVFILLLIVGAMLNILFAMGIHLPNPLDILLVVFQPISDRIELLLS